MHYSNNVNQKAEVNPHQRYPVIRFISILQFLKNPDIYKAIAFFIGLQALLIATSVVGVLTKHTTIINGIIFIIGLIVIALAVKEIQNRQQHDATRGRVKVSSVILAITTMIGALFITTYVFNKLGITLPKQSNQAAVDSLVDHSPIVMVLIIVIAAPIIEELIFRELLPYAIGPSYISFIIASVVFAALHSPDGVMGWVSYLIIASGFLFARLRDNNIYTAIIVHTFWNATSVVSIFL